MRSFFLALLFIISVRCGAPVKHLAGPPSEFEYHSVPNPATVETLQRSASRNIWFDRSSGSLLASHSFPVESAKFVLSFASPVTGLRIELLNPQGQEAQAKVEKQMFRVDDDTHDQIPVTVYIVDDASVGQYKLNVYHSSEVEANLLQSTLDNPRPDAVLTFIVDDNLVIHSHLQSYLLKVGQDIGLVASVKASATSNLDASLMGINKAVMEVILPDGSSVDMPMHDDGFNGGDLTAGDLSFSASMQANLPGVYILESILDGDLNVLDQSTSDAFERSAQHVIVVSAATVDIAGTAFMKPLNSGRVQIEIGVTNGEQTQPTLRAYAEVWGTSGSDVKPAAWIGGIVELVDGFVGLELDLKWLQLAGVSGPLYLKNVYLSDMETSFPVAIAKDEIHVVKSEVLPLHWAFRANTDITITKEMRQGVNPLPPVSAATPSTAPTLLLLPGYCTDVNPWSSSASHFTNAYFPVDKGNYSNQVYATRIIAMTEAQKMTRFGIVAHSQGGMVATHMHNFFFTGLEAAEGERLIQSVGTPYNGNTAAGSAANLGEIFGVGCGTNSDLSRDGAVNWVSGISMDTRADVHFFTTTYKSGTFFGDYCSLPMNLVLQWPNDGVTEQTYATLAGAQNMGNKEQWCHSTEMGYAPQFTDPQRNAEMNTKAAR